MNALLRSPNHWQQGRAKLARTPLRRVVVWLRHRGLTPRDVVVGSYPRSGSTWLRFMLYQSITGEDSSFDLVNRKAPNVGEQAQAAAILPGAGRLLKTHEPFRSDYHRAIHLYRDPRDVVLSEFRYLALLHRVYHKSFDEFIDDFITGNINPYGSWADHVTSWLLGARSHPENRILSVKYEDLRANPGQTLRMILRHVGIERSDAEVSRAIEAHSIEAMRSKEESARLAGALVQGGERFVGQGLSGHWRVALSDAQRERLNGALRGTLDTLAYPSEGDGEAL